MQIVLLEKVANVGSLGDIVGVKAGFARNFLIPQGKAVPATKDNVAQVEARRAELEKAAAEILAVATARAEQLNEKEVTISSKAGDEGKLFGSVGTADIAKAVTSAGVEVSKAEVRLPNGAIRQAGDFEVAIQLHTDVVATIKLSVVPEE